MATATNSRIFGVSHSGAINNPSGFTTKGRLHYANSQSQTYQNNYSNVFWCNGVDETRFTWSMAYIIKNGEGNATVSTTVGVDDGDYTGAAGTADAYIRFKGGANGDDFIAACKHYVALNETAGHSFQNPVPVQDTPDNWKNWMDVNADYWSNFVVVTTTTTEAPTPSTIYEIRKCGTSLSAYMRYTGSVTINAPGNGTNGTIFTVGPIATNVSGVTINSVQWVRDLNPTDTFTVLAEAQGNNPDLQFSGDSTTTECVSE